MKYIIMQNTCFKGIVTSHSVGIVLLRFMEETQLIGFDFSQTICE